MNNIYEYKNLKYKNKYNKSIYLKNGGFPFGKKKSESESKEDKCKKIKSEIDQHSSLQVSSKSTINIQLQV